MVLYMELNVVQPRKGGDELTDFNKLKEKIDESGMTMVALSEKTGILRETLYNRLNGRGEFHASEIVALSRALNLTKKERDAIFLTGGVA